ncbi:hypothetical protein BC939DRAFT_15196 [Gamsiella multidivaricata]|uniref:uncharacterized protein n=1 Tax=Gamsiella multidivaricata TaxID=101098 RepID=UPI00221F1BC6|nr:uncharacterized protein BC939DRAFT_15196 [Gamsiella multidivaricata]KAI7829692.1 hypothetical protein BC939DRAFT_15196 [Gamsiella multidivaricata]
MPRFLKSGKVVVILNGRYAGKKAVIVKNSNPTTAFESSFTFQWSAKGYGWKAKASSSTSTGAETMKEQTLLEQHTGSISSALDRFKETHIFYSCS